MNKNIREILSKRTSQQFATEVGTETHKKMQKIVIDGDLIIGNNTLIQQIKLKKKLLQFFTKGSQTEVPLAGVINGKFISRRIDRLVKNDDTKNIVFLDYKTDTNKNIFREKYISQMKDYKELLKKIYPGYSVRGLILWLQDFTTEEIC